MTAVFILTTSSIVLCVYCLYLRGELTALRKTLKAGQKRYTKMTSTYAQMINEKNEHINALASEIHKIRTTPVHEDEEL